MTKTAGDRSSTASSPETTKASGGRAAASRPVAESCAEQARHPGGAGGAWVWRGTCDGAGRRAAAEPVVLAVDHFGPARAGPGGRPPGSPPGTWSTGPWRALVGRDDKPVLELPAGDQAALAPCAKPGSCSDRKQPEPVTNGGHDDVP